MEQSLNKFVNIMLVLLVVSGLLQLVGLVTPGWMVLNTSVFKGRMGLFYTTFCVEGGCHTKTYDEFEEMAGTKLGFDQLDEFRGETISGLIFCCITFVVLLLTKRKLQTDDYRKGFIVSMVTAALSAILTLVATGQFANGILKADQYLKIINNGYSMFGFPYSVFLSGIGGILAGICVLAIIWKLLSKPAAGSPPPYSYQVNEPSAPV